MQQIEPGTSPKHRYELIKATLLVIIGALITVTIVYGLEYFTPKDVSAPIEPAVTTPEVKPSPVVDNTPSPVTTTPTTPETPKEKVYSQDELNKIFEMDKKKPGTKLFYSPKLGVGFTYATLTKQEDPIGNLSLSTVKEINNKIYLTDGTENPNTNPSDWGGNSLEIFTKDSKDNLEQAIAKEFLIGANQKDCFVAVKKYSSLYRGYISYVPDKTKLNDDNAYYGGAVNCPAKAIPNYIGNEGTTSFFVLNEKDVNTSKYGFLSIGSGAQSANTGYKDNKDIPWYDTIRFLK
jgi:hypothetical protein